MKNIWRERERERGGGGGGENGRRQDGWKGKNYSKRNKRIENKKRNREIRMLSKKQRGGYEVEKQRMGEKKSEDYEDINHKEVNDETEGMG